jgi:hypothetical protein
LTAERPCAAGDVENTEAHVLSLNRQTTACLSSAGARQFQHVRDASVFLSRSSRHHDPTRAQSARPAPVSGDQTAPQRRSDSRSAGCARLLYRAHPCFTRYRKGPRISFSFSRGMHYHSLSHHHLRHFPEDQRTRFTLPDSPFYPRHRHPLPLSY